MITDTDHIFPVGDGILYLETGQISGVNVILRTEHRGSDIIGIPGDLWRTFQKAGSYDQPLHLLDYKLTPIYRRAATDIYYVICRPEAPRGPTWADGILPA